MATDLMMQHLTEWLWIGGLAATPLALLVGVVCRSKVLRPATRHMLWLAVLASFVTPVVGAWVGTPQWFRSDRLIAAADTVLARGPVIAPDTAGTSPAGGAGRKASSVSTEVGSWTRPDDSLSRLRPGPISRAQPTTAWPVLADAPAVASLLYGEIDDVPLEFSLLDLDAATATFRSAVIDQAATPARPSAPIQSFTSAPRGDRPSTEPHPRMAEAVDVRAWFVRVLGVRDAVAMLPPVPASMWMGGALFVIAMRVWRTCRARRWVRTASPADAETQAMVRKLGSAMGLSRTPQVVFVERAVSPMIWCGLRPVLILPVSLWKTLDIDSRRAVLAHELAHVRRWDHVVCWVEALIGAIYWWHPVVWWARQRLRDEAESSCDAWVTSLFPSGRRAYASALVVTGSYLSSRSTARGPLLGMASGSSRRLARRITMVMTQKTAPKMSGIGALVATFIVATGTFVMPGLACPPEQGQRGHTSVGTGVSVTTSSGTKVRVKRTKQAASAVADAECAKAEHDAPDCEGTESDAPGVSFFGEAPALDAMRSRGPGVVPPAPPAPAAAPRTIRVPRAPRAAISPEHGITIHTDLEPLVISVDGLKDGRTPREYSMPSGKLEAFAEFMSRGDVPVLIEMHEGHIVIWGSDQDHEVFGGFVGIVGPGGEERSRATASAPRAMRLNRQAAMEYERALAELARSRESIGVDAERARERAEVMRGRADQMRELADNLREQVSGVTENEARLELNRAMQTLSNQSDALESESSGMEDRVQELEQQIEAMEEKIQELEQQLGDAAEADEDVDSEAPEAEEGALWDVTPEPDEPGIAPPADSEPAVLMD